ncbi:MAG TPA: hypothetical protein VF221_02410, partial [Chloroflexota bacterium]
MMRTGERREGAQVAAGVPLQIVAATSLEYWAARWMLGRADVVRGGVGLPNWRRAPDGAMVVVCGLAGGLRADLSPGTVVIPREVGLPDGRIIGCDATLVDALLSSARALGFAPEMGPLLTAPALVTGTQRHHWSKQGFVAADMETGLLAASGVRVAAVRVILDSANRGIAEEWLRPGSAALRPALWGELFWLCRAAPSYSLRAARVL